MLNLEKVRKVRNLIYKIFYFLFFSLLLIFICFLYQSDHDSFWLDYFASNGVWALITFFIGWIFINKTAKLNELTREYLKWNQWEVRKLIKKIIKDGKYKHLSLKTVQFIETLTDEDLEFLKKNVVPFVDIENRFINTRKLDNYEMPESENTTEELENEIRKKIKQTRLRFNDLNVFETLTGMYFGSDEKQINTHIYELALILNDEKP